jgi:hypothetical protein
VGPAVPRHVHEADEFASVAGTDPAQALPPDLTLPGVVKFRLVPRLPLVASSPSGRQAATPPVSAAGSRRRTARLLALRDGARGRVQAGRAPVRLSAENDVYRRRSSQRRFRSQRR